MTTPPTGRTTDHASKPDSSHGGEHAARDRIAATAANWALIYPLANYGILSAADDDDALNEIAHRLAVRWGADIADAVVAALPELAELDRLRGLLEIALHLCRHGDLAPGGGETWADWARTTETHLRAKEAPDVR